LLCTFDHSKCLLGCVYNPPTNSKYYDEKLLDIINDELHENILLHRPDLYATFNARTSSNDDHLQNTKTDGNFEPVEYHPPKRVNRDQICNTRGEALLEFCKSTGLYIVNGRIGKDSTMGSLTCLTRCGDGKVGGSTVDYLLVNERLFHKLSAFEVLDTMIKSDHLPLIFTCRTVDARKDNRRNSLQTESMGTNVYRKVNWSENTELFMEKINSEYTHSWIMEINRMIDCWDLPGAVSALHEIMLYCCSHLIFEPKQHGTTKTTYKPWFNKDCRLAKKLTQRNLNMYRKTGSKELLEKYLQSKKNYITCRRRHKRQYKIN